MTNAGGASTLKLRKNAALFALGGAGYVCLELLWRGRSHISMFFAGGTCFLLLGSLSKANPRLPQPFRMLAGAAIITSVELAAGLLCNRSYNVWDYRSMPGNFCGQICPLFTMLWIPIAFAGERLYTLADRFYSRS